MNIKKYGKKEMEKGFGKLTFGKYLESYRKCEELSQKDFAMMLGISAQSLCNNEKGRRIPSPKRVCKIAVQIGEPEKLWLRLAFQGMLRREKLDYTVSVA